MGLVRIPEEEYHSLRAVHMQSRTWSLLVPWQFIWIAGNLGERDPCFQLQWNPLTLAVPLVLQTDQLYMSVSVQAGTKS